MQTPSPAAPRQVDDARHQRVHDAVRALVREQGVQISMDAVAARAGCSKQTLYARYGSKQSLLLRVLSEDSRKAAVLAGVPDSATLRPRLVAFARDHLARLSEPGTIGTARLITGQACQFPDEVRALYGIWIEGLQERLATWLQQAMRRGLLRHDDPHSAAELLLGMIVGLDFDRQRFLVPHRDTTSLRTQWAEFAVDSFLRAFAPPVPRT
jgi:AcrR family transcriptional regulator